MSLGGLEEGGLVLVTQEPVVGEQGKLACEENISTVVREPDICCLLR